MIRWINIACIVAAMIIAAVTCRHFAAGDAATIITAMVVAWAVPLAVARRCSWWTPASTTTYNVIALLIIASGMHYMWFRTMHFEGCTLEMPYLYQDGKNYYNWALHHFDGRCPEPNITFVGFSVMMLGLFKLLGVSLVWPTAMNIMLTLTSVAMCGSLAVAVTRGRTAMKPSTAATLAMVLLGTHFYYLSHSYLILKEASIYVAVTMIALALVWLQDKETRGKRIHAALALYAGACVILALVRAKYINFAAIGVLLLAVQCWRNRWRSLTVMASLTAIAWLLGMWCSDTYSVSQQVDNMVGGDAMTQSFGQVNGVQSGFLGAMDGYFHLPAWKKVLYLPVTVATQYIIPFPWGETKDGWISVMPRIQMGWYMCGGIALCYYAFLSWRRRLNLGMVAWWPVICAAGIAYISAGTVSRYFLPFQPMLVAVAVYVIATVKEGTCRRLILRAFTAYAVLLLAALAAAFAIM